MLVLGAFAGARAESVTIQHTEAGNFAAELAACGTASSSITELAIKCDEGAFMDVDDFKAIRDNLASTLVKLDLSDALFYENTLPAGTAATAGCLNNMKALTECVLPESLSKLSDGAFVRCEKLVKINIPAGIATIPQYCFNKCYALSDIELPEGLTGISGFAFEACTNLPFTSLPEGLGSINQQAFRDSNVAFTELPSKITELATLCFYGTNVSFKSLPTGIKSLPDGVFMNTSVNFTTLPENITTVSTRVFNGVKSITYFEIPDQAGLWSKIPNGFFYMANDEVERTFVCRSLTPPTANNDGNLNGSFSNKAADNQNTTFKVLNSALSAYQEVAPYNTMKLEALTTPVTMNVVGPVVANVKVALEVDGVEHTDFSNVLEGTGTLRVSFDDGADEKLYVKSISRTVTTPDEDAEEEVEVAPAAETTEVLYICDEPTDDDYRNTVKIANVAVGPNMPVYTVEIGNNGSTTVVEVSRAASFVRNGDNITLMEAGATLYDAAGNVVAATTGYELSLEGLGRGVYILRAAGAKVKILK